MTGRRARVVRAGVFVVFLLLLLYAGAVGLRVLYPVERITLIREEAAAARLDPDLVCSVVRAESRFHVGAVSRRGAVGLMQLMPDTAAWIAAKVGVATFDLRDPETNLRFGTWYLRYLVDRFGRMDIALAAYNAGPSRVDQWLAAGKTTFPETAAYVQRVLRAAPVYRVLLGAPILVRITPSLLF